MVVGRVYSLYKLAANILVSLSLMEVTMKDKTFLRVNSVRKAKYARSPQMR